ncbi:MAG: DRTGG domain-containing protein [Clostridia bacterium]|nr:DRTGG domain-containing protein [Clostridia bacterium]
MRVEEFAQKLDMKVIAGEKNLDKEVSGMYVCDLMSWVMSHASRGDAWITVHTHLNVIAVALLTEVACVIIPEGIAVDENTINKANEEGVVLLGTTVRAYEICWKAHNLLG